MTEGPSVLFVGHDASRTGAPLLLLHFLGWLAESSRLQFEVLLTHGGELVPEYARIARTRVLARSDMSAPLVRLVHRFGRKLLFRQSAARIARQYPVDRFPLIYSNTVANGDLVGAFGRQGHRIICHAHEMKFAIQQWGGASARQSSTYLNSVIAASQAVKCDIIRAWQVPEDRIEVVHEFGQPVRLDSAQQTHARHRIRQALHIGDTDILVAMCGTMDWRKGGDLFLQLAGMLHKRTTPRYRFIWIGGPTNCTEDSQYQHDLQILGISDVFTITGPVENPHEYMSACDLFALTSREDPCPLAMIEAAGVGLPIVCFSDAGGAAEFASGGAGVAVPYLDSQQMAGAIAHLATDDAARIQTGTHARAKAFRMHSLSSQAPKLLEVIRKELCQTNPQRHGTSRHNFGTNTS